jgi:PAS domain S-box-containing protein
MIHKGSIRVKFIIGLALIITIVVLSFSIILISSIAQNAEKHHQRQLSKTTTFSQENLSIALWQYDYDYVAKYLGSLFLYEDVVYASVIVDGKLIREKSISQLAGTPFSYFNTSKNYITSEANISYNNTTLGSIRLVLSKERVKQLIFTTSKLSIAVIFLVNVAVFLVLYFLFSKYIFHPLKTLENSVRAISSGKIDESIDTSGNDEIGQLASSFQEMMRNLQKITASRDELNLEIQARKQSEGRIRLLNTLKEKLLGPGRLMEKLRLIADGIIEIIEGDFCRIWLILEGDLCDSPCRFRETCYANRPLTPKVHCLHLKVSSGKYTHIDGKRSRIPLDSQKIDQMTSGDFSNCFFNDILSDPRLDDHQGVKDIRPQAFAGYNLFSVNGETIGVMALYSRKKIRDKDNEILRNLVSTASEVIQVSHAQEQLIESEKKFRNLFEKSQVGMYRALLDDGKIIEANQKMAEIFEFESPEDCIGKFNIKKHFIAPIQLDEVAANLLENGVISNELIQIKTNRSSIKWIQISGYLSDIKGSFEGVAIDITDKKNAEEKVKTSLEEKEILIKEIHHRVKNNMQIIQSLLSLQANKVEESEYKKLLMDSNSRIKSMALIHEILYQSDDISRLDLNHYFESIVSNLSRIYQDPYSSITIDINVEQVDMEMDLCIACGLIINELLTNTYKYGFIDKEKGNILISLSMTSDDNILLKVADDGPGFPEKFDIMNTESLGLKIVRILVTGQLQGKLTVLPPPGATIEILFPLNV